MWNSPIGYDVLANAIDRNAGKTIEFTFAVAVLAKLLDEDAIGVEDLDAMIAGVGDDDAIVRADGEAARPGKGSGLAPRPPTGTAADACVGTPV